MDLRNAAVMRSIASSHEAGRCPTLSRTSGWVRRAVIDLDCIPKIGIKIVASFDLRLLWMHYSSRCLLRAWRAPLHSLDATQQDKLGRDLGRFSIELNVECGPCCASLYPSNAWNSLTFGGNRDSLSGHEGLRKNCVAARQCLVAGRIILCIVPLPFRQTRFGARNGVMPQSVNSFSA